MQYKSLHRFSFVCATIISITAVSGCYKDKGNYTYATVAAPVVSHLDSIYNVFIGDSLVVKPVVTLSGTDKPDLSYQWTIHVPPVTATDTDIVSTGNEFHILFRLAPSKYSVRLAITNNANGMKYFHDFIINGQTPFSMGTTVLSDENGVTQLSFIKPGDSVEARLYEAVNPGEKLPGNPTQLLNIPVAYQPPTRSYWIFGKSGENTGVEVDANTFKKIEYLKDNFFSAPDTVLDPQNMFVDPMGVISGVINGVLYSGTTSTWNEAPTYGMFDQGTPGDYICSPETVLNYGGGPGNFIGFDMNRKQFIRFNIYGGSIYFGTQYNVINSSLFDPANLKMDLIHLQQINGGLCYAYCKAPGNDTLYELEFNAEFDGPFQITAMLKRPFAHPELLTDSTKWQATQNGIIYFNYQDKVYRYNPTNQDFITVSTSFGGKTVTMVKVMDQNTLTVGVDGSIYYLDISTGKYGTLIKKIDGLPGKVIDMTYRAQ